MEEGEVNHKKKDRKKKNASRSRSRDKHKKKSRKKSQKRSRANEEKDRHRSPDRKQTRNHEPKNAKKEKKEARISEQLNNQDEEENKMIQIQLNEDEDTYERKRQERLTLLSKYKVNKSELESSKSGSKSEQIDVQIQILHNDTSEMDVTRQNYLKMLETLRDQEVQHVQVEEQPKKKKKMMDMFDDDIEEESQQEITMVDGEEQNLDMRLYETDDEQRYYRAAVGEILNKEYKITYTKTGKGVFSNVVKAIKLNNNQEVAIKFLRSDEIYLRSGEREKNILEKLNAEDKDDKKHIIRMYDSFEHRKHLCLVFEPLEMNLRDFCRIYGKGNGLSLNQIQIWAIQLFIALAYLRKHKLIHADIKPDNILVGKNHSFVKLCDFGTAFPVEESSLVDYLVSRYYRAPEVIIGYPYDQQLDVWALACTLFELYTGKFLFSGNNNNEMLKQHIQTMGRFSLKMLKRGALISKYFDQHFAFLSREIDPVTKQEYLKPILLGEKPTRPILSLLKQKEVILTVEGQKQLLQFKDFLEKCLQLDPKNRMTPEEALQHPFLQQLQQSTQIVK